MSGLGRPRGDRAAVSDGRARELPGCEIAEQITALFENPSWAKAVSHPLRSAIVALLREGPLSPARPSERLPEATLGTLAYHFRFLEKLRLVEVGERIPRRGAIEHVYRLKEQ